MNVANMAHGAGAVIGWLFGRAVLSQRPIAAIANVCLLCLALALLTLYMPWDGYYDFHRGIAAIRRHDYAAALKWFDRAADRLTGQNQAMARDNADQARQLLEDQKGR
jgi:hypothetical protein